MENSQSWGHLDVGSAEENQNFALIAIEANLEIRQLGELGQLKRPNLGWVASCLPSVGASVAARAVLLIGGVSSVVFIFFFVVGGWVASGSCTSKNLKNKMLEKTNHYFCFRSL